MRYWILVDNTGASLRKRDPQEVADVLFWGAWMESADRVVERTEIGQLVISTVFLGIDHSFGSGPPILFETMVFGRGDDKDDMQTRYCTWEQAEQGHDAIVRELLPKMPFSEGVFHYGN